MMCHEMWKESSEYPRGMSLNGLVWENYGKNPRTSIDFTIDLAISHVVFFFLFFRIFPGNGSSIEASDSMQHEPMPWPCRVWHSLAIRLRSDKGGVMGSEWRQDFLVYPLVI